MKRTGNLYESICDPDNLRLAWVKAKKGKEAKQEVYKYGKNLQQNLLDIREQLITGNMEIGNYHFFTIYEPKERLICAASFPERVLHHAIMNVCHPVFEKYQIYHSYATRVGKGQYAALDYAKSNQKKYRWFCKLDIRKYFASISHTLLMRHLSFRFKDKKLLDLFDKIIHSYESSAGCGLPIGNLTSQYFANYYLGFADHYLLEKVKIPAYVRYMDDMVLWHHCKSALIEAQHKFTDFIKHQLELSCKPSCINSNVRGLPFLGYVIFPDKVRLNRHSKQRFITKYKHAEKNILSEIWTQADYARHIVPLIAFTRHAQTEQLRRNVFNLHSEAD
ncbi:MAG: RNA-directed DNA polymerase [Bacteroidales bacterium]|nr:RNA-directed DNA polymerase [Bacteroidales bacterium]